MDEGRVKEIPSSSETDQSRSGRVGKIIALAITFAVWGGIIGIWLGLNYYFESGAYMWGFRGIIVGGIVGAILGIAFVR